MNTTTGELIHTDVDAIWVIGHRNPDTDCTIAALTYAALKQSQSDDRTIYVAGVLGTLNNETRAVLSRFRVPPPLELRDVLPRVNDVMLRDFRSVDEHDTLYAAAKLIHDYHLRAVPILGKRRALRGTVSVEDIADRYLRELQPGGRQGIPTTVGALATLLEGTVITGDAAHKIDGDVHVMTALNGVAGPLFAPGGIVIVGAEGDTQSAALSAGAACLVVVGGATVDSAVCDAATTQGAAVIATQYDAYAAARLVDMAVPVSSVMRNDPATVSYDTLIEDAQHLLVETGERNLVVLDDELRVVGMATRGEFLRRLRRRVILVDHSQRGQSVEGLDTAEIVEVVDHHNIGDIGTGAPIFFLAEPVGATATLIAEMYLDPRRWYHIAYPERVLLDETTAGLLLAAIISDTLLLRSPTTTDRDRRALATLAERTGIDTEVLAKEMFAARSDISARTAASLVGNDYKPYAFGGKNVGVAQVDVLSHDAVRGRYPELLEEMEAAKKRQGLDVYLLMMTDIIGENTDLLFDRDSRGIVERAFGVAANDAGHAHIPGMVSRKKQLIPPLAASL